MPRTARMRKYRLTPIELFLIAATVFVVGFVGYAVYQTQQIAEQPLEETEIAPRDDAADRVPDAPEVESAQDLDAAVQTLDEIDPEAGLEEDSELESQASEL
ncbi:MAG: hypothetical protein WD467_03585 [Candidatus Saccharimonadales bacterium]